MAGNIIETILIDNLVSAGYQSKTGTNPLEMDLGKAIKASREESIISEKVEQLSNVIRSYRNLIHPGRLMRLSETVDESSGRIALALVNLVLQEVAKTRMETYGYTAEQIVSKVLRDKTSISIIDDIIKGMKNQELEKLLIKDIPENLITLTSVEARSEIVLQQIRNLRECFGKVFKRVHKTTKQKMLKSFISVLKEGNEDVVLCYERNLLRCSYLTNLESENDAMMIVRHVLGQLKEYDDDEMLGCVEGISKYLQNRQDIRAFIDSLVIIGVGDTSLEDRVKSIIVSESIGMFGDRYSMYKNRCEDWIRHYKEKGYSSSEKVLMDAVREMESYEFVPEEE